MKVILKNSSLVFQIPGLSGNTDILFTSDAYGDLPMAKKIKIDTFVCSLMNSGVWSKLQCLYLPFITTATKGRLNVKTTIDNDTVTIDTWEGTKYALQDNVGVVVEANANLSSKIKTYTSTTGLCLFGTAENILGTLYKNNNNRIAVTSSVRLQTPGTTERQTALISDTIGNCGAVSFTETEINMTNNNSIFHDTVSLSDATGSFQMYLGFNFSNGSSNPSTIKYFGIADGLTQTEFTALVAAIKNFQSILA